MFLSFYQLAKCSRNVKTYLHMGIKAHFKVYLGDATSYLLSEVPALSFTLVSSLQPAHPAYFCLLCLPPALHPAMLEFYICVVCWTAAALHTILRLNRRSCQDKKPVLNTGSSENRCRTNRGKKKKNHCVLLQIFPSLHTCIIQFYIFMSLNIHE